MPSESTTCFILLACDRKLESYLKVLPTLQAKITLPPPTGSSPATAFKAEKVPRLRANTPDIPGLREELVRICGVDLTTIDGISLITAQTILAEIGTDMSRFPSSQPRRRGTAPGCHHAALQ